MIRDPLLLVSTDSLFYVNLNYSFSSAQRRKGWWLVHDNGPITSRGKEAKMHREKLKGCHGFMQLNRLCKIGNESWSLVINFLIFLSYINLTFVSQLNRMLWIILSCCYMEIAHKLRHQKLRLSKLLTLLRKIVLKKLFQNCLMKIFLVSSCKY